jgi:hypothetical protein
MQPGRRSPNDSVADLHVSVDLLAPPTAPSAMSVSRPQENETPPLGKKLSAFCSDASSISAVVNSGGP